MTNTAIVTSAPVVAQPIFDQTLGKYTTPVSDPKYFTALLFAQFRGKFAEALAGKAAAFVVIAFIAHMLHVKTFRVVLTNNNTAFKCHHRGIDAAVELPAFMIAYLNPKQAAKPAARPAAVAKPAPAVVQPAAVAKPVSVRNYWATAERVSVSSPYHKLED